MTVSGHLVSLNPCNNQMAAYLIPGAGGIPSPGALANPLGIATSGGVVGFTEADGKKVGMLIPNKHTVTVTPSLCNCVPTLPARSREQQSTINPDYGTVTPELKAGNPGHSY